MSKFEWTFSGVCKDGEGWGIRKFGVKIDLLEVKLETSCYLENYTEGSWDRGELELGVIWVHTIFKDRKTGRHQWGRWHRVQKEKCYDLVAYG